MVHFLPDHEPQGPSHVCLSFSDWYTSIQQALVKRNMGLPDLQGHQEKQLLQEVGSLWKADIHHQIKLLEPYITFGVSHVGV